MMRNILFLCVTLMILGCKKGKADFTMKGTVTDATLSTGMSNATIKLYEVKAGGGTTTLIDSAPLTDGSYSFTFPRNSVESYTINVERENYFPINETVWFSDLTLENDNLINFSTTAKSWVKLHFVDQNPQNGDVLEYIRTAGKSDCEECCPAGSQFLNETIDTIIICPNNGNAYYTYNYWINGGIASGTQSVVTVAFDTTELLLNYQ